MNPFHAPLRCNIPLELPKLLRWSIRLQNCISIPRNAASAAKGTITTLTKRYTPEKTEATVVKVWDDEDNQDGKRPSDLKVTLSNGTEVTLDAENKWTATVTGLPKYAKGEEIV